MLEEENGYEVTNTGIDTSTGERRVIKAKLDIVDEETMLLHLDPSLGLPDERYQVLGTDYESYASVWNCEEFVYLGALVRREFGWILSKDELMDSTGRIPDKDMKTAIKAFEKFGIDVSEFVVSDLKTC